MRKNSDIEFLISKALVNVIMCVFCIFTLLMIAMACVVSVSDETSIIKYGYSFHPDRITTAAYEVLFAQGWVANAYMITITITVAGTLLSMLFMGMIAFTMANKQLKYRNIIALLLFIPMLFSPGIIPWYLWITKTLHLKNTIFALIFPGMISPFWVFIIRNFFMTVPSGLTEAAHIDGAGAFRIFITIMLPISTPVLATVGLFTALGYWNNYYNALWLIDQSNLYPLQYMLYRITALMASAGRRAIGGRGIVQLTNSLQMATFVVTLGPIVLVYPFVQKYFVKGIMIGAVKG